ncbi:LCP family protein [Streptomyces sp. NPDC004111]|uniref:LCP family protein n=1 Tax=Streptomyces sp. NPDC004111 TaxID=3364690 RepID=UPI0036B04793
MGTRGRSRSERRERAARGAPGRPVRRGRRWALWGGGAVVALLLLAGGAAFWVYQGLDGNIRGADVDAKLGTDRPVNLSPGSKNILVVGSDSRAGGNAKYGKGLVTMQSDTLMVLHLSADRSWATVVSLPRDSWVPIPACDKGDGTSSTPHTFKINSAFAIGGTSGRVSEAAACTIRTVERNTGLRIDHFVSVDFQGFKGMVNALDGIEICPRSAIHDPKAQLDLEAGCQTVRDEQALGYVRTRYSIGDGSDLGRINRQQEFLQALMGKAQQKLTSPGALYGVLDSITKSLTTDNALAGIKPLYGLASELKGIEGDRLTFLTVPNYAREADVPSDRANVVWQFPQAAELFDSLAQDREVDKKKLEAAAKNPVHAKSVRVRVLNGSGRPGAASKVAQSLTALGYSVTGTGNAPAPVERTAVEYPAALKKHAEVLASRIPGAATRAAPVETVTLVVGPDFRSVR